MVALEGPTHIIRYLNPAFAYLAAKSSGQLIGYPFAEAVPQPISNGCLALLNRVLRTGMPETLADQEHRQTPPVFWSYAMWAILGADEQPVGVMIRVTDATEAATFRRQAAAMNEALIVSSVRQHELIDAIRQGEKDKLDLQARLFQAQKLESLAVLAGGIAHDLNNMLTPVLGYAELAENSLPANSTVKGLLKELGKNARRAADLVQQILAYGGKGRFVIQPVDLSGMVEKMRRLLSSTVSKNTTVNFELSPGLPRVEADASQLQQVVANLFTNASDALEDGDGTITVRTGALDATQSRALAKPEIDQPIGPRVFLEVTDTGVGIAADIIDKICDPFFTTKFTGRGLGLAVVQGVVRGHNGTLEIQSEPGQGSTFRVLFPCITTATPEPLPVVPMMQDEWQGTGTVLLVDDEAAVRDMMAYILKGVGLTVTVAGNGLEALSVFGELHGAVDAVVLDLTMPKMGGLDAAKALRKLKPDLPIVLTSGFSVADVTSQTAGLGITGFVQKPFNPTSLLAAVRHALGQ